VRQVITPKRAKMALEKATSSLEMRPGTADSDINALELPCSVPRWAMEVLAGMAEDWITEKT
jgi:hypothetical protein